jgi:hypothetical protein
MKAKKKPKMVWVGAVELDGKLFILISKHKPKNLEWAKVEAQKVRERLAREPLPAKIVTA